MTINPTSKTILVVDDETTIREVVRRYLERDGFNVVEAADGYAALDAVKDYSPDLIILDLMLPGIDGLSIARQIHSQHRTPIIMLTAKGEPSDRVRGLDLGADDYVVKPFSPQELISRVFAVLRRVDQAALPVGQPLLFGPFKLDPNTRLLTKAGADVPLTAKEFELLWLFASHPGRVFSRSQLLERVWGSDYYGDPTTVTVHIRRLRQKVETDASKPHYLRTVWGVGYKFEG
ncbi:MAG: response regulator transcription factor [Anaerolineae bacterium]|nr:response regulator transcription factor [Anaerolineae bacterium]